MPLTPSEQADNDLIRAEGLHRRRPRSLRRMRRMHADKRQRLQEQADELLDADGFRGLIWKLRNENEQRDPVTGDLLPFALLPRDQAVALATTERDRRTRKLARVAEAHRLMVVELGFRRDGKVDRTADYVGDDEGDDE